MTASLTREVADVACVLSLDDLPEESVRTARHCVLDWFGVTIAGFDEPLADILRDTYATGGDASIVGSDARAAVHDAALVNGATSHALDYDDVSALGHPTAPLLPAVLAVAESIGASGRDVLTAFAAGYEAGGLIAAQAMPTHYARGFHSTATLGSLSAAAGVARLLGLDPEATSRALGLAGTQAAGLKAMFGTMAKPFHAGKAAANGVMAATLAARGFEARPDVLETDQGFFSTQTDATPKSIDDYPVGKHLRRNLFKYHAACYLTHSTIECARQLRAEYELMPESVVAVRVRVPEGHLKVCHIPEPETGLETKFSLRHTVAFALADVETSAIETYCDANATRPDLVALRAKVDVEGVLPPGTQAEVEVEVASGERFERALDVGVPSVDQDAEETALRSKFESLARPRLGEGAGALADALLAVEAAPDLGAILSLSRGTA